MDLMPGRSRTTKKSLISGEGNMKARNLSLIASALLAIPLVATADESKFYLSPVAGIESYESSVGLDQGAAYGLSGLQMFNDHWGAELLFLTGEHDVHQGPGEVDVDQLWLRGIYSLGKMGYQSRYEPFVSLGVGHVSYDAEAASTDDETEIGAGLGVRFHFTPRLSAALAAEHRYATTEYFQSTLYTLGLSYSFGGEKPAPVAEPAPAAAPAPLDSDGDGVYDDKDECPNTPRGREVDEKGCEYHLKKEETMKLDILFDVDKSTIKPQGQAEVERAAKFLKRYANVQAVIEGHTDSDGSDSYNMKLSQARADAVRATLINQYSISPDRLEAKGYGETRPVESNASKDGKAQNRRVVAVFKAEVEIDPNKK
jgi:OOP family OmpA-OmpF porin